jgi:hypothetical protein
MKIAILANGETVQQFTKTGAIKPKYDEVWGLNQQATWKGVELDKCFIMDDLKLRMPFYAGYDFVNWLKDYKKPIITSKAYDEWPTSEAFPIKEIAHYFGLPLGVAMYSTPDYMIALAIYLGAIQIDLYGVDMSNKELPTEMVLGTTAWIAVAQARGVYVRSFVGSIFQHITNPGIAMECGLYGYVERPRIEDLVNTDYFQVWKDEQG